MIFEEGVDLNFFTVSIAPFARCSANMAMKDRKFSTDVAPKGTLNIILTLEDDRGSLPNRSDSGTEEIPQKKSSKRHSIRLHIEQRSNDVKSINCIQKH